MKISRQQITARGISQQSGLDTLSSIINYTGEFINFGNAFSYINTLSSATDYATTTTEPHIGALVGSPPSVINLWYRYHSSGALYTNAGSATSTSGLFALLARKSGGLNSFCGMYQKLLLTTAKEYKISVQTTSETGSEGTLYINTYTPFYNIDIDSESYILTSSVIKDLPNTAGTLGIVESLFTARSSNDILLIYATTESTSSNLIVFSDISIQEKQEYLTQVYATDMWGNAHKVLRVAADQTISDD